jgi:hypothetical protein
MLLVAGSLVLFACRRDAQNLRRRSAVDAPPVATATPEAATTKAEAVELPNLVSVSREVFQTRSTLELTVHPDDAAGQAQFGLVNDTTGLTLIPPQALSPFALADDGSSGLALASNYDIVIRLYPAAAGFSGKLVYAQNVLRLVADDAVSPKFATVAVTMRDFAFGETALASFSSGSQRQGGLQGDIGTPAKPYSTNGTSFLLTSGIVPLLNY